MTTEKETMYDNVRRQWAAVTTSVKFAGQKIGRTDYVPLANLRLSKGWALRQFLSIALRIPTAHDFASLARAHERVHVQNVRDFPQTKLDSEINAPFLLNEHGDPKIFFQVFTKKSLIKNIFEEEKKFDSRTLFFFGK